MLREWRVNAESAATCFKFTVEATGNPPFIRDAVRMVLFAVGARQIVIQSEVKAPDPCFLIIAQRHTFTRRFETLLLHAPPARVFSAAFFGIIKAMDRF